MSQFASSDMPFQRVTPYDAPTTLMEQLLDGEVSARGIRNTLFDTARLTPEERSGVVDRMKAAAGRNRVTNALIDVAANPWVWVMFATSPAGARAIGKGGLALASTYARDVADGAAHSTWLGALTGAQVFKWGPVVGAMREVDAARTAKLRAIEPIEATVSAWMKGAGVQGFSDGSPAAEEAKHLLWASLSGADREVTRMTAKASGGNIGLDRTVYKPWVTGVDLEKELADRGLTETRDQIKGFYEQRKRELFAENEALPLTKDNVSTDKVLRTWRGLKNTVVSGGGDSASFIRNALGDDAVGFMEAQHELTTDKLDIIKRVIAGTADEFYVPRNTYANVAPQVGKKVRNLADVTAASGSTVLRQQGAPLYDPDSLEGFGRVFAGKTTEAFDGALGASAAKKAEWLASGDKTGRMLTIDPFEGTRRYNDSTSATYAWHVADAAKDEELALLQRQHWGDFVSEHKFEGGVPTSAVFADSEATGARPLGGFSYADAVAATHVNLDHDKTAQKILGDVLVPAVTGRMGTREAATKGAALWAAHTMGSMADSWIGRTLEETGGKWGARVVEKWREGGNMDATTAAIVGKAREKGLTQFFYLTHLGWNAGSALINLTQPVGLAATWLGGVNTLKGYGEGFEGLGKYLGARWAKYGVRPITEIQREELIRQAIPHAELLGLASPVMAQLDSMALSNAGRGTKESWFDHYTRYAMGMFSNTEIVNKVTTAGAVSSAYKAGGRGAEIGGAAWRLDVKNMVSETQFGSHPLNTPVGFFKVHPLLRQFMGYPLRTLTGLTYTSRFIGDRSGGWGNAVKDFGRAMGLSAVMFEGGRDLAGINLERAGIFASATDLVPGFQGGRFDERESPLPVPPIIDIPYSVMKAVATDDRELLAQTAARLNVFGGIALSRALGAAPGLPRTPLLGLQRTSVDWNDKQQDGTVPVYDSNGKLLQFRHPAAIILQAAGLDLGAYKDEGELVKYLASQADEIKRYKGLATSALLEGRHQDYEGIGAEFEKRFKVPLVLTPQQLKSTMKAREMPRVERTIGALPPELRGQYRGTVEATMPGQVGARGQPFDERVAQQAMEGLKRAGYDVGPNTQAEHIEGVGTAYTPFPSY